MKKPCPELRTDGKLELVEDLMRIDLKKIIHAVQNVSKVNIFFRIVTINFKLFKIPTCSIERTKLFLENLFSCKYHYHKRKKFIAFHYY